jgi:hypothetical protein
MCKLREGLWRYICVPGRFLVYSFKSKEITMKQLIAIIATVAAATAFAQTKPAEAPKAPAAAPAAPAASAPAPAKKEEPKKADVKSAPAGDKKAEAPKK